MKSCRGAIAALLALAFAGCNAQTNEPSASENTDRDVGGIKMQLTLPDDSELETLTYNITGPGMYSNMGTVPVGNSTIVRFRVGGIPVNATMPYSITLTGTTSFGNMCTGTAQFTVANNQTTTVLVPITCGASDNVGDVIVDGEITSCPVVTAVTVLPGETEVGTTISLEAEISHGNSPVLWTGGTFADANAYATTYTCPATPGNYSLTVAINNSQAPECDDAVIIPVTCTLGAACGNSQMDAGEQCDDGNADNTDGCTNTCRLPACGDTYVQMGAGEQCDDGGTVTESCVYGQMSCVVCNATCQNGAGTVVGYCGDGVVNGPEACDGTPTCTPTCTVAGAVCGNGILEAGEQCDPAPAGSLPTATCAINCTTIAPVSACDTCRRTNCVNYLGAINTVAGCFNYPDAATGNTARAAGGVTTPYTAAQVQACVDAIDCAMENDCAHDTLNPVNPCYCGNIALDTCSMSGPAAAGTPNAPACRAEWEAAAETTVVGDVLLRISDLLYPTGWAFFQLECDRTQCASTCL